MPKTKIVLFKEEDGRIPLLDWFDEIPVKAVEKCRARLERLEEQGYELRRPVADYLMMEFMN